MIGIRDGKQVSYDDFAFLKLPYPEIGEQREIAEILNAAEKLIHHQQVQVNGLQAEKRALMADLLTGKRRVRLPQSVSGVGV